MLLFPTPATDVPAEPALPHFHRNHECLQGSSERKLLSDDDREVATCEPPALLLLQCFLQFAH